MLNGSLQCRDLVPPGPLNVPFIRWLIAVLAGRALIKLPITTHLSCPQVRSEGEEDIDLIVPLQLTIPKRLIIFPLNQFVPIHVAQ